MDTENFILKRRDLVDRLAGRRALDISDYPFKIGEDLGVTLPSWARLALSFVGRGSVVNRFLEVGLPLALPFLMKKQTPSWGRLLQRFFLPKS